MIPTTNGYVSKFISTLHAIINKQKKKIYTVNKTVRHGGYPCHLFVDTFQVFFLLKVQTQPRFLFPLISPMWFNDQPTLKLKCSSKLPFPEK